MKTAGRLFVVLLVLIRCSATITVTPGTDPNSFVLCGKMVTKYGAVDGKLVIQGSAIVCVGPECTAPAEATRFTITDAWIFPGFIDAHNHVAYNVLPKFRPTRLFKNRSEWQNSKEYKKFKQPYETLIKKNLACEAIKYAEMKALISGVTTIEGTSPGSPCVRTLIRNAENQNQLDIDSSHIRTFVLDIQTFDVPKEKMDFSVTKSFVVHLAEGVDRKARAEFATLKQKGLLTAQTAIIHGTALGEPEFQEMAQVGAKLIWSPQSNLTLYGQTTEIPLAIEHGVPVSLGVDWNPTGSDDIFEELRAAAKVNEEKFAGAIPKSSWIPMITENPAEALALSDKIGTLAPGLKADITVLASEDADPTESLLKTRLQDVEMVWVGGELLYGDAAAVEAAKPNLCEPLLVHGSSKQICVKDPNNPVPKSDQTKQQIQGLLEANMRHLAPLVP
jgi:5-methylthioadenosine/S-adenosylhomocysteine deaminase